MYTSIFKSIGNVWKFLLLPLAKTREKLNNDILFLVVTYYVYCKKSPFKGWLWQEIVFQYITNGWILNHLEHRDVSNNVINLKIVLLKLQKPFSVVSRMVKYLM
jgi:hypothetical protein